MIAGHVYVVVMCDSRGSAERALQVIERWVMDNGLSLSAEKTRMGDCRVAGEGFEFLGYRFECGRRNVRKKSLSKLRDKIRELTPRSCGESLSTVIKKLNRVSKGWFEYFKHAERGLFTMHEARLKATRSH